MTALRRLQWAAWSLSGGEGRVPVDHRGRVKAWPGFRGRWPVVVVRCGGHLFALGSRVKVPQHATQAVRRAGLAPTVAARRVQDWRGDRWEVQVPRSALEECRKLAATPGKRGGTILSHFEATPEAQAAEDARLARIRAENAAEAELEGQ